MTAMRWFSQLKSFHLSLALVADFYKLSSQSMGINQRLYVLDVSLKKPSFELLSYWNELLLVIARTKRGWRKRLIKVSCNTVLPKSLIASNQIRMDGKTILSVDLLLIALTTSWLAHTLDLVQSSNLGTKDCKGLHNTAVSSSLPICW